jgi:hypothetical protein
VVVLIDVLRGGGGAVALVTLTVLVLAALSQILARHRAMRDLDRTQDERKRLKNSLALATREASDCRVITLLGLLSPLAILSRLRNGSFDDKDVMVIVVLVGSGLWSHFGWGRSMTKDESPS